MACIKCGTEDVPDYANLCADCEQALADHKARRLAGYEESIVDTSDVDHLTSVINKAEMVSPAPPSERREPLATVLLIIIIIVSLLCVVLTVMIFNQRSQSASPEARTNPAAAAYQSRA